MSGIMSSQDFEALRIDSPPVRVASLGPSVTSLADLTDVQIIAPLTDGQVLQYIAATGKWTNVDPQLLTNNFVEGYSTQSGDANTTTFTITHGFGSTPTHIIVDPQSPEADEDFTTSADNTNITIAYTFPPPQGTNNLSFYYRVS